MAGLPSHIAQMVALIRAEDLAAAWGYAGANNAFRDFCAKIGIKHVPGRPGWYDPRHVRHRLDAVQGLDAAFPPAQQQQPISLVEKRRARIGASA